MTARRRLCSESSGVHLLRGSMGSNSLLCHRSTCQAQTDENTTNAVDAKNALHLLQMLNIHMLTTSLDTLILARWIVFDCDKTCVISETSIHLGIDVTLSAQCVVNQGILSSRFTVSSCLFATDQNQISHIVSRPSIENWSISRCVHDVSGIESFFIVISITNTFLIL